MLFQSTGSRPTPDWHRADAAYSISLALDQSIRFDHQEDFYSSGIHPFLEVPPQKSQTDFDRQQYRCVNEDALDDDYKVEVGADYRDESGDSTGTLDFGLITLPTDFSQDRTTWGLFFGAHARVLPPLLLPATARRDDPDGFETETTYNLGAAYDIAGNLSFRLNWGEAFKLPSFFALGHGLVGNPDLKPEKGESWDVGLQWRPTSSIEIETVYFSNKYRDLIDFDAELFTNVNRNKVETSGVELQANWSLWNSVQLISHATYTDIDLEEQAIRLTGRPEWKSGATFMWEINSELRATLDYQWTGSQNAASRHTGETVVEKLDSYDELDFNIAWKMAERITLAFALDNALDQHYFNAVGFSGPGRSGRVSISLHND